MENKVQTESATKRELKTWTVHLAESDAEMESTEIEKERRIEEIKAGKVRHSDGSFYSAEDEHLFIIVVPTERENNIQHM